MDNEKLSLPEYHIPEDLDHAIAVTTLAGCRWDARATVDWVAISNARESGRVVTPDHVGLIFDETEPLPTYLFAFVAGRFQMEAGERAGRTFRMLHRETDAEVRAMPGAFGDSFRAIEALPGVTPLVSGLPYFFVRGAPVKSVSLR